MYTYRICRVNDYGTGPYCSNGLFQCPDYEGDCYRHPPPYDDSLLVSNSNRQELEYSDSSMYYCFSSINQLKAWFYDESVLIWLYANDFCVVEFSIDDSYVVQGNSQCVMLLAMNDGSKRLPLSNFIS